ncbi:MAG: nuclear transport factor 2 family protein [bacterium]|jgi:ketosteroid isomerase-like protein
MKKLLVALLIIVSSTTAWSQSTEELKLTQAVSEFVAALESGERSSLEKITSDALSYGHSNGLVENKKVFIDALASKQADFLTVNVSNQTVAVSGKNGIVRHRLDANIIDKGKQIEAHLNILLVFRKEKGEWKLLARQASKIM